MHPGVPPMLPGGIRRVMCAPREPNRGAGSHSYSHSSADPTADPQQTDNRLTGAILADGAMAAPARLCTARTASL